MKRTASALWKGNFKAGSGTVSTASGALQNSPYSAATRFETAKGTDPEELVAAAHSGCFVMALSLMLQNAGFDAESLDCTATITLEKLPEKGFTITSSALALKARVPRIDHAKFQEIAAQAKAGCPISKLLNTTITLDATLVA